MNSNGSVRLACEPTVRRVPIDSILPLRQMTPATRTSVKYRRIQASIREVGIIEPLVVFPQNNRGTESFLLQPPLRFLSVLRQFERKLKP